MIKLPQNIIEAIKVIAKRIMEKTNLDATDFLRHGAELEYDYVTYYASKYPTEKEQFDGVMKEINRQSYNFMRIVENTNAKAVHYVVFFSTNEFTKSYKTFTTLDGAREYFRKTLTEEFRKAKTDADDNGESVDECVQQAQCLLNDHHHGIEICLFMG